MIESKKNILIVDDDPKNNLNIKDLLEFEGYHVFTAENGSRSRITIFSPLIVGKEETRKSMMWPEILLLNLPS